jgi:hypothetical protein
MKDKLLDILVEFDHFVTNHRTKFLTDVLIGVLTVSLMVAHIRIFQVQSELNQLQLKTTVK